MSYDILIINKNKKMKNSISKWFNKEDLKEHKWLCKAEICLDTLKELEKVMVDYSNIDKWETKLKKCNHCYLEKKNYSYLNTTTRWTVSSEVHHYNSTHKK